MSCYCDCGYDGDRAEFMSEKIVCAKKSHTCCECFEPIEPGEKYERVDGKWDGHMDTYKTCLTCVRIRDDYCSSWIYGELRQTLIECIEVDYMDPEWEPYKRERCI